MKRKDFMLIAIALVLASVYVIYFTDWFRVKPMVISHTSRPLGRDGRELLLFSLGRPYNLTEIKVVSLAEWQTNKLALPLWHLLGKTSNEVNRFVYGQNLRGMDPEVEGARPEPLQPGVRYRLFITAGSTRGTHDFQTGPAAAKSPPAAVSPGP